MKKKLSLFGIGVGLLLAATSALAHHAFSAEFDMNKPVTLRGKLIRVELTNPHGWIYMEVEGPDAKVANWRVEIGPTNAFVRRGLRRTDFVAGSEIIVKGFGAKNGTTTVNGRDVTFADGRNFFLGSSDAPPDGAEKK